jgi:hypothetical protein
MPRNGHAIVIMVAAKKKATPLSMLIQSTKRRRNNGVAMEKQAAILTGIRNLGVQRPRISTPNPASTAKFAISTTRPICIPLFLQKSQILLSLLFVTVSMVILYRTVRRTELRSRRWTTFDESSRNFNASTLSSVNKPAAMTSSSTRRVSISQRTMETHGSPLLGCSTFGICHLV